MSNVSQGAGLSQGIVNFHFKSKELLFIETLRYISNEYLAAFQHRLKSAGNDPRKKIIAIIKNDFDKKICNRDKIAVWYTFLSEVKFKVTKLGVDLYTYFAKSEENYKKNVFS